MRVSCRTRGDEPGVFVEGVKVRGNMVRRKDPRAPFHAVYFNGEPQYDLQLWIDDRLESEVPSRSPESEAVYKAFETHDWVAVPLPDVKLSGSDRRLSSCGGPPHRTMSVSRAETSWK